MVNVNLIVEQICIKITIQTDANVMKDLLNLAIMDVFSNLNVLDLSILTEMNVCVLKMLNMKIQTASVK